MINDRINKKRMKLIGALFDKFCHFEKLTRNIISCGGCWCCFFLVVVVPLERAIRTYVRTCRRNYNIESSHWQPASEKQSCLRLNIRQHQDISMYVRIILLSQYNNDFQVGSKQNTQLQELQRQKRARKSTRYWNTY